MQTEPSIPEGQPYVRVELSRIFEAEIATGEVGVLEDSNPWVEALTAAYPMVDIRLDLGQIAGAESLHGTPEVYLLAEESPLADFWRRQRERFGVEGPDRLVVFGDAIFFALEMSAELFSRKMIDIFELSMHWYVFPKDLAWCFGYMMEDDAFCAPRPERLPPSWETTSLLECTREQREAGLVEQVDVPIHELLAELFPMSGQRIDWARVEGATKLRPRKREGFQCSQEDLDELDRELLGFWHQARRSAGIAEDCSLWVGSPQVGFTLRMTAAVLETLFAEIGSILMELHFLRREPTWCCSYHSDMDTFFGSAPPSSVKERA